MRYKDWNKGERHGWTVFLSFLFIAIYGYTFNCGDQEEHLPYVYKLLNHNLYTNDYIVPLQVSNFSIRFYFAWLLYGFGSFVSMPILVCCIYISCLGVFIYFLGRIAEVGSNWKYSFIIGPFISLLLLNTFTIGGNTLFDNQLTCSCFASALSAVALYNCILNRNLIAAAFAGLASLFQLLIGMHTAMIIIVIILFSKNGNRLKMIIHFSLIYLIFSSAMLIPILLRQSESLPINELDLYNSILFNFRNAHHYIPSCFPLKDYIKTFFCWLIIFSSALFYKSKWNKLIIIIMAFVIFGCLAYTIGFESFGIASIGKLQLFKITGWVTILGAIPLTFFLSTIIRIRTFVDIFITSLQKVVWPLSFAVFILLMNTSFISLSKLNGRYQMGNYNKSTLTKLHEWIAVNTNIESVILPLPNDDSFLCEAQRSIPVGYKAIIHEPFFLLPWYDHFYSIYGVRLIPYQKEQQVLERAMKIYPTRPDSSVISTIKIDYRIWDLSQTSKLMLARKTIIFQEGNYIITKFDR